MSSHANEGAQQPEAPAGEPTAAGEVSPVHSAAAPAEAAQTEAATDTPSHTTAEQAAPDETATLETVPDEAGTAEAGTAEAGTAEAEVADAGATTIVLDPAPENGRESELDDYADEPYEHEPVSKLAIAALVTGVVALVPLAVGFGVAALAVIRRTGRRGRGMALTALLASAAWVIVGGAVGTVGALTHGFKKPVTVKYHEAAVFKLREGQCVNTPNGQLVAILPCSTPHEGEVFATFALPASAWPGTARVATAASTGCASRLTGYINPQLAISLTQSYVYPDQVAWTAGTRTVICEVHASSGQLTGSVRGAT